MEEKKTKLWSSLESLMKDNKKRRLFLICGLGLIAVIFLSGLFPEKEENPTLETGDAITMEEYGKKLEEEVEKLISQIEGAGSVRVMLTLENGSETVYQSDRREESEENSREEERDSRRDLQETVVMIEGENGRKQALIKTERPPSVQGVVVLCDGAEDVLVQKRVTEAITTAFSISSARVAVVQKAAGSP